MEMESAGRERKVMSMDTVAPDAAAGRWDAIASSLVQHQTQNAQSHQRASSDQQQLQGREFSICYVKFMTVLRQQERQAYTWDSLHRSSRQID